MSSSPLPACVIHKSREEKEREGESFDALEPAAHAGKKRNHVAKISGTPDFCSIQPLCSSAGLPRIR